MGTPQFFVHVFAAMVALALVQSQARAQDAGYNSIVNELSSSTAWPPEGDPLDSVKLHAGLGMATSYVNVEPEHGKTVGGLLAGIETSFGIDLLSNYWLAEGSVRSFNNDHLTRGTIVGLKEFDLKVIYHDTLASQFSYRFGTGLAARYLTLSSTLGERLTDQERYTTPSAIFLVGLSARISGMISVGTDFSLRTAMISDTVDKTALNAALRLDAQF